MTKFFITVGEPFGIGPEITWKALAAYLAGAKTPCPDIHVLVHCDFADSSCPKALLRTLEQHNVTFTDDPTLKPVDQANRKGRAEFVVSALRHGLEYTRARAGSGLVTGPIDKALVADVLSDFDGHTAFLGRALGAKPVMHLSNGCFDVIPITQHIPLADVSEVLKKGVLSEVVHASLASSGRVGLSSDTQFAVCGVDPHGGELWKNGIDQAVLKPQIQALANEGVNISGPHAADGLFAHWKTRNWDVALCPYHDQALIPSKVFGLDQVVNTTLGLPLVRTSPGHGVAYDLFGKDQARHESMLSAIKKAEGMISENI